MSNLLQNARLDIDNPFSNAATLEGARFIIQQDDVIQSQSQHILELEAGLAAARAELIEARDFIRDEVGHAPTVTHLDQFIDGLVTAPEPVVNIIADLRIAAYKAFTGEMRGDIYAKVVAGIDNVAAAYGVPVVETTEDSE
jgi:uncharacterized membrane protein YdfJ with MMPL/SSD domain